MEKESKKYTQSCVKATHNNADRLYQFLLAEAKKHGDVEENANLEFSVWKWKNESLVTICVSIVTDSKMELYVRFQKTWGDNYLFRQFTTAIIQIGNQNGTFDLPVKHSTHLHVREDDIPVDSSSKEGTLKILLDMCESTYPDTKLAGAKSIIALCTDIETIKYLVDNERIPNAIASMTKHVSNPSLIDVECVTTALIILERLKSSKLNAVLHTVDKWLPNQKEPMWAEARRRLANLKN